MSSHEPHLDEGMVEQLAGGPPRPGLALQAVRKEVLPFWAQPVRNGGLMPHSHLVHDLEVVFIFMPRPLRREKHQAVMPHGHRRGNSWSSFQACRYQGQTDFDLKGLTVCLKLSGHMVLSQLIDSPAAAGVSQTTCKCRAVTVAQ